VFEDAYRNNHTNNPAANSSERRWAVIRLTDYGNALGSIASWQWLAIITITYK